MVHSTQHLHEQERQRSLCRLRQLASPTEAILFAVHTCTPNRFVTWEHPTDQGPLARGRLWLLERDKAKQADRAASPLASAVGAALAAAEADAPRGRLEGAALAAAVAARRSDAKARAEALAAVRQASKLDAVFAPLCNRKNLRFPRKLRGAPNGSMVSGSSSPPKR